MDKKRPQIVDEVLVIEAQAGNVSALDRLIQRYHKRLLAYARRLLGNEEQAWDACQEAWMGIVKGLDKLDDPALFSAWAYRIVTNKCRDRQRREMRNRWQSLEAVEEIDDDGALRQRAADVREAIGMLPDYMQAVLILRYFEGFSIEQISEILNAPEGTVKSRLNRARAEFKRLLEKQDERF
jgi:RNA polymerase sigma-70 factor (ECF subfamily)